MIRAIAFVALILAVVSAQRWPMITVNASGEIVLQSLTRASSFQITPVSITTGPTSGTAAVGSGVTALTDGVSAYQITSNAQGVSDHGVSLPTPTVGRKVTLYQSSTLASYAIWTASTSNYINSESGSNIYRVSTQSRRVECAAVSTTRWNCYADAATNGGQIVNTYTTTSGTAQTLTEAQAGQVVYYAPSSSTGATTYTIPACSTNTIGLWYEFYLFQVASATTTAGFAAVTLTSSTSNILVAYARVWFGSTGAQGGATNGSAFAFSRTAAASKTLSFATTANSAANNFAYFKASCTGTYWIVTGTIASSSA